MKITIESTTKIVELTVADVLPGILARVWEGVTDAGIPVHCFIPRIAVHKSQDATEFEKDLFEQRAPTNADIEAYPLKLIL